jgi:hemolysin D
MRQQIRNRSRGREIRVSFANNLTPVASTALEGAPDAPPRAIAPIAKSHFKTDEFLPAALSIVEVHRSPIHWKVSAAVLGLLGSLAALAFFGHLEDFATAPGRTQAVGRTKVVEPRVAGQVSNIRVKNGDRVGEGDTVVELDPTAAIASRLIIVNNIFDTRAQIAGQQGELTAVDALPSDARPVIAWDADIPPNVREREESVMRADLAKLSATLTELNGKRNSAIVARDGFASNIAALKELETVTTEHVAMDETLAGTGWNSRMKVLEITGKLRKQQVAQSAMETGLAQAGAEIAVVDSQIVGAREAFKTATTQALAAADRQLDQLKQQLAKADQSLADMTLRAPVTGVVENAVTTTIGQVVTPGQQLMDVVPEQAKLEVVAYVDNTTVGFVKAGENVDIKVKTFPYASYGTIPGIVSVVAKDALPADGKNTLQSAALDGEVSQSSAAQKTGNIVFPVTISLPRSTMVINGKLVQLTSGMEVSIDFKTERRPVIDYIASPLTELITTAAHEQ